MGRLDYGNNFEASVPSSFTVQRSSFSIFSARVHVCVRWTVPPCTMKHSPVIGQSAVARYATNGDTFAGSQTSKPSAGACTCSDSPGVASVRRVRAPGAIAALRRVRRLLPGDPQFGDPLSTAGQGSASTVARIADKMFDDESMLTRELSLGALQVWQSMLDKMGKGAGDTELTILFTDLVGFSSWAMTAGDDDALSLLRQVEAATETPVIVFEPSDRAA